MLRIAALFLLFTLALASSAAAQNPSYRELEAANLRHVVHSVALHAKPGRAPRRSLSRGELRAFADHVRATPDGTLVLGVHLYGAGTYAASLVASQAMASDIVRRLEALGIPRGRVIAYGFGANRRIAAMNRARARHTPSHVDLFVVPPAYTTAATQPNAPVMSPRPAPEPPPVEQSRVSSATILQHLPALMSRVRGSLRACTQTTRDLTLTLAFDERGRVAGMTGPFSAGELRCFQAVLANERIPPPGARFTIGVPLRAAVTVPPGPTGGASDVLDRRD